MKIERTRNATRNIIFGLTLKIYQIILPFVMRTAMIYLLGIQYLGLNSLFTSVLQVINLAELGVGSAMIFSMYKPIAEDDYITICALMKLYRLYYRLIGAIILVAGLILLPFIPKLISGSVPEDINVYVLYFLSLLATVLTYWLFSYKNSIFQAFQRIDITSKVTIITDTIKYIFQILALAIFHNYYYYVIVTLGTQVLSNIITAGMAYRMYPEYTPKGNLGNREIKQINRRIKDLFTSRLGAVIINSSDSIVISSFLGLTALAIYQNYYFIITAITGVVTVIFNACTAGIGNSLIVESEEKNFNDFNKFTLLISWMAGFCTVCLICLFQPFIEIWIGKDLMLAFSVVICLCIYYFVYEINALLNLYKDAAGMWHEDRFRPLVTALSNLGLSLLLVNYWEIYGVILSTVVTMIVVGMPWLLHNLFTVIFDKRELIGYLKKLLYYTGITAISCLVVYYICSLIPIGGIVALILKIVICCIFSNLIFVLAFSRMKEFRACMSLLNKITRGKVKFLNRFT